jgi:hypothetical protein
MRNLVLLSVLMISISGFAQNNKNDDLYIKAFKDYFIPGAINKSEVLTGKMEFRNKDNTLCIDTVIVQKEDYLPSAWPDSIIYYTTVNYHLVKYLSKNEIDNFGGKHVSLLRISPARQDGDLHFIKITSFSRVNKTWTTYGYRQFKFIYDPATQKFKLIQPVITLVNG